MQAGVASSSRPTSVVGAAERWCCGPVRGVMVPQCQSQGCWRAVQVNVGKIDPGQQIIAEWRGKPVFIVHRTKEMLDALPSLRRTTGRPGLQGLGAAGVRRSQASLDQAGTGGDRRHLHPPGLLADLPSRSRPADLGPDWKGGYFCLATAPHYDLAGRAYRRPASAAEPADSALYVRC